ncbi:MAG: phosphate/phosphite/phosphonate ABC transporter substrate-binding protein [Rhodocyclaceae bacterium]|nr:phosphate/phosphite/phosphonate ABC transporter substrate-binding protein [Rhodocyclaceae bacterium]
MRIRQILGTGLVGLALGVLAAGLAGPVRADEPDRALNFGVLNQQSPARTAQRWNPILKYLSEATGLRFQLKMGPTVQETDAMMGRGEFDLAFTNHNFAKEYDGVYKVIARWAGKPIYGAIAVPADSPVRTVKDLAGKRVAFPSKEAFVAYAVPSVALRAAKVRVEEVLAGNQEGALAQLRARQVEAAAVNSRFLTQYAAQHGMPYREVFSSEGYAELPVIAHPRLPRGEIEAIQKALLAMKNDPKGTAALEASGAPGFEPATERDYDNARVIYRRLAE